MIHPGLALAAALLTAAAPDLPPPQAAPPAGAAEPAAIAAPPTREPGSAAVPLAAPTAPGVYLGAGFGAEAYTSAGSSPGQVLRLRLGVARSRRLLIGLEGGLIGTGPHRLVFQDVGATFFPRETGFFVRGALGVTLRAQGTADPEQGPNLLAGLGYAFGGRSGPGLSLNLEAQHHARSLVSNSTGGLTTVTAWLGLDWY